MEKHSHVSDNKNEHHRKNHNNSNCENSASKRCRLLSFDELPDYMQDNEYILKYYISEMPLKHAFFSLFQWHNETINIWTHLLGFLLFVGLTVVNAAHVSEAVDLFGFFRTSSSRLSSNSSHNSTKFLMFQEVTNLVNLKHIRNEGGYQIQHMVAAARWPFYVYLTGSMFCLLSSTICHLFCCHSHHLNLWLLRMDYTGITIMIITTFFPPIYYIFECKPIWQIMYLCGICIFGACTIATLLSPTKLNPCI